MVYSLLDESDKSKRVMASARRLDSSLVLPRLVGIQESLNKKQYETALAACDSVLDAASHCVWARQLKSSALRGKHDLEGLENLGRYLVSAMPDAPVGYDCLAQWAEERGMVEETKDYEDQAARRRPPMASYLAKLLRRLRQDEYKEAIAVLEAEGLGHGWVQEWSPAYS